MARENWTADGDEWSERVGRLTEMNGQCELDGRRR